LVVGYFADEEGTTYDPKLTVVYTKGTPAPPSEDIKGGCAILF